MQAIAKALGTTRGFVLAAFVAALVPRLTLALIWPQRSGDTKVYLTVARNILENACVSLSDPASGACLPHWGGNQLPGYPAFVALVWKLFGESDIAIVIAQSVIGAAAVAYAGYALLRFLGDARRAVWGVALLAFSPLCVPWTRWILTDGLSIAATLWVFSELVLSIARRQLRILAVALSAITALFLRYDNIVLIVPIALVGVALHGFTQASRKGVVIAVICAIPVLAWWYRSVELGLPNLPDREVMPDGSRTPTGYIRWGNGWSMHTYDGPAWIYPIYGNHFDKIRIPSHAYDSEEERKAVKTLLDRLRSFSGQQFPEEIDRAFSELADRRDAAHPLRQYVLRPVGSAVLQWALPFDSSGWPIYVAGESIGAERDWRAVLALYLERPTDMVAKLVTAAYRLFLVFFAVRLFLRRKSVDRHFALLVTAAGVHAILQSLFHVYMGLLEARYLLAAVVGLEVALAAWLGMRPGAPIPSEAEKT